MSETRVSTPFDARSTAADVVAHLVETQRDFLGQRQDAELNVLVVRQRAAAFVGHHHQPRAVGREVRKPVAPHRVVGQLHRLAAVGEMAAHMAAGWPREAIITAGRDEALVWLRENVSAADVVLVKASRGAALEVVVEGLLAPGPGATEGSSA